MVCETFSQTANPKMPLSNENAKHIDKFNILKYRDANMLLRYAVNFFKIRGRTPEVIVEIGSGTGRTTAEIGRKFSSTKVIGVECDSTLREFACINRVERGGNVAFAFASIGAADFWQKLRQQFNLDEHSVDLVLSTHSLDMSDPGFEIALDNIDRLLKFDGVTIATFSIWSKVFEIEKSIAGQPQFADMFAKNQHAAQLLAQNDSPNRISDRDRLKQMLRQRRFGHSPEIVIVSNQIKIKLWKQVQDAIMCICPLGSFVPESNRLNFYERFFDAVYEQYFGTRTSVHTLSYEYTFLLACRVNLPS